MASEKYLYSHAIMLEQRLLQFNTTHANIKHTRFNHKFQSIVCAFGYAQ